MVMHRRIFNMVIFGENTGHTKPEEDKEIEKNWKNIDWGKDKDVSYVQRVTKTKFGHRIVYEKIDNNT